MAQTRFNADYLEPGDNVATGHAKFDFKDLRPVEPLTWSNVAGAGGIYSSVHDLSKWMRVQLDGGVISGEGRSEEHTSELQSLMRISYAVFCLKKKKKNKSTRDKQTTIPTDR